MPEGSRHNRKICDRINVILADPGKLHFGISHRVDYTNRTVFTYAEITPVAKTNWRCYAPAIDTATADVEWLGDHLAFDVASLNKDEMAG